jgi:hypothetical protein
VLGRGIINLTTVFNIVCDNFNVLNYDTFIPFEYRIFRQFFTIDRTGLHSVNFDLLPFRFAVAFLLALVALLSRMLLTLFFRGDVLHPLQDFVLVL